MQLQAILLFTIILVIVTLYRGIKISLTCASIWNTETRLPHNNCFYDVATEWFWFLLVLFCHGTVYELHSYYDFIGQI